jgi:hypothetical protein
MNAAPFFPVPLPGEIHFSILARYHVLGAGALSAQDREAITGSMNPTLLLAAGRNTLPLATYVAKRAALPRDQVLALHTVLPYYRPFVDLPGCALEAVPEYLASFRHVRSPTRLRYCPDCVEDSIKIHGQPYWRRQHQLPFVTVCVIHRQRLQDAHEITQWNTRLPLPPSASVASDIEAVDVAEEKFAKISNLLLTQSFPAHGVQALLETWRASWYQHQMHEDGRWKYLEILGFYRSKLGDPLVDRLLIESGRDSPQEIPWFLDFFERNGRMHHPVMHILFAMVFFEDIDKFFEQVNHIGNRI